MSENVKTQRVHYVHTILHHKYSIHWKNQARNSPQCLKIHHNVYLEQMNKWEKMSNEWKIKISENKNIEKWLSPIDAEYYFRLENEVSTKSAN